MSRIYLINYDNGSRYPVLPQNLYHLQACLVHHSGIRSDIIDFNRTKDPYVSLLNLPIQPMTVIGLGFISGYWPHQEAQKIAKVINGHPARRSIKFVIGGHGPSAAPEYYMELLGADAVFTGAADISFPEWCAGPMDRGVFPSKGYKLDISQAVTGPAIQVYKRIRFPNTKDGEFAIQLLSGRGCPYKCAFCFRMGENYERYPLESVIDDIRWYYYMENIRHFQFSDELLMTSARQTDFLLTALESLHDEIGVKLAYDCNGRLNVASRHQDLMMRMKSCGFRYVNFGCESMSQDVLDNINKKQTVNQIKKGVKNTVDAGLSPGLNFMWGNPGDNVQSLWDAVEFIQRYSDRTELRTIRPVTPYPGTELFNKIGITVDQFYHEHKNSDLFSFHFMQMGNAEADLMLCQANEQIYRNFYHDKVEMNLAGINAFYSGGVDPSTFRGFREV